MIPLESGIDDGRDRIRYLDLVMAAFRISLVKDSLDVYKCKGFTHPIGFVLFEEACYVSVGNEKDILV